MYQPDDTKMISVIKKLRCMETLQKDLDNVARWSSDWSTQLNADKVVNDLNSLPVDVVEARSLNCFKSKLDKWLFENREVSATAHVMINCFNEIFREIYIFFVYLILLNKLVYLPWRKNYFFHVYLPNVVVRSITTTPTQANYNVYSFTVQYYDLMHLASQKTMI
ncbi:hypothetical protein BpHYR1_040214 [Brachionus plicatilis]|uniref:RNA-directed DNA polymerase from mobile element jockey-like n=1 Tax=Brachionus plicatilis TaxID=10195 RepID=A0A3M7S1R9_BRAPC|nr:hypothetical protein BpHYR1_040214 [Brachionus plicatilis]